MYKRKHPERFNLWWRPLTRQGDPSHRYDLVGEAFDAGYEAGKEAALVTLGKKLLEQYATPIDSEGRPTQETSPAPGPTLAEAFDRLRKVYEPIEETPVALPFTHWSKDPLLPYANCNCSSCVDQRAADAIE